MDIRREVVIVGAGAMGACTALALAARGIAVTVIERDARAINRTSLRNSGKLHLGLIYAAEPGGATARLQLRGALHFAPLLRRWGVAIDAAPPARPFVYLAPHDSLMGLDALAAHYAMLDAEAAAIWAADPGLDYLGTRPARLAWPLGADALARWFSPDPFAGGFETAELAVDTEALGTALRAALAGNDRIELLTGLTLRHAERRGEGFALEGEGGPEGAFRIEARQVVNATWENLFLFDRMVGLEPAPGWLHRMKYRMLARLPAALEAAPSSTLVIGPYGDVVVRPGGLSYLSWYPTGLRGWSADLTPPADWDAPCRGEADPAVAAEIAAGALEAIDAWFPGAAGAEVVVTDAGAILAHGKSDVDDPESDLHGRTLSGLVSRDGWHSANSGKLTTAPLVADAVAGAVAAGLGRHDGRRHDGGWDDGVRGDGVRDDGRRDDGRRDDGRRDDGRRDDGGRGEEGRRAEAGLRAAGA